MNHPVGKSLFPCMYVLLEKFTRIAIDGARVFLRLLLLNCFQKGSTVPLLCQGCYESSLFPQTQRGLLKHFKGLWLTSFLLLFVSSYNFLSFSLLSTHCAGTFRKPRKRTEPWVEPIKGTGFGKLSRNFSFSLEKDNTKRELPIHSVWEGIYITFYNSHK